MFELFLSSALLFEFKNAFSLVIGHFLLFLRLVSLTIRVFIAHYLCFSLLILNMLLPSLLGFILFLPGVPLHFIRLLIVKSSSPILNSFLFICDFLPSLLYIFELLLHSLLLGFLFSQSQFSRCRFRNGLWNRDIPIYKRHKSILFSLVPQ